MYLTSLRSRRFAGRFSCLLLVFGLLFSILRNSDASTPRKSKQDDQASGPSWAASFDKDRPEFIPGQIIVRLNRPNQANARFDAAAIRELGDDLAANLKALDVPALSVKPVFTGLARQLQGGRTVAEIARSTRDRFPETALRSVVGQLEQAKALEALAATFLIETDPQADVQKLCAEIGQGGLCAYAQPNWKTHVDAAPPNDPYYTTKGSWNQQYDDLWGLKAVNALDAWDRSTGKDVVIAIVDTGVDYTHPDLAANIWKNTREIPGNGVDDDGNGFVDDTRGYDFSGELIDDPNDIDNDPRDSFGHGTHVAGTAAAAGNNKIGIIGVAYEAQVMPVKVFPDRVGFGSTLDFARGIEYASRNGADLINMSLGGPRSPIVEDACALAESSGVLVIASAGNSSTSTEGITPAEIGTVVTVGAMGISGGLTVFTNFGPKLDVMAPGLDVLSCLSSEAAITDGGNAAQGIVTASDGTKYLRLNGTSMAAPHVTGIAALILSKFPTFTAPQIRQVIRTSTDRFTQPLETRHTKDFGYGRINAASAVRALDRGQPLNVRITSPTPYRNYFNSERISITGTVEGGEFDSYKVLIGEGDQPQSWQQIGFGTQPASNKELATWSPGAEVSDGIFTVRLVALNKSGTNFIDQSYLLIFNDKDLLQGWPRGLGGLSLSNPVLADLTGDGKSEIVYSGNSVFGDGRIFILNSEGNPINDAWPKPINDLTQGTPTLADLDGDGRLDLVAAGHSPGPTVYAYKATGEPIPGFPVALNNFRTIATFPLPTPTAADIDGDGRPEILMIGGGFTEDDPPKLIAISSSGQVRWSATMYTVPIQRGIRVINTGACTPMVGDITGDNQPEIVVAYTRSQEATNGYYTTYFAFSNQGKLLRGWPVTIGPNDAEGAIHNSGALADLDRDGKKEVIVSSDPKGETVNPQLVVLRGTGRPLKGWPQTASDFGHVGAPPAVGDLDGDGKPEVVLRTTKQLIAYHADGSLVQGFPVVAASTFSNSPPVIGDTDGDGKPEILFTGSSLTPFTDKFYYLFGYHSDGKPLADWPKRILSPRGTLQVWSGFALGDINGDAKIDAVIVAIDRVYVYRFGGTFNPRNVPWGMYQQNPQHTGALQ